MFEKYKVNKKDFDAIEEGIDLAYSKKLDFFPRGGLEKADVLLFDSEYIYIWSKRKHRLRRLMGSKYNLTIYKWKHNKKIEDRYYRGCGGIPGTLSKDTIKILGHNQFFFCAPVTCFIKSQKKMKRARINPFITKESYIFTMIHEFGHHYYHLHNSNVKSTSNNLIRISSKAWDDKKIKPIKKLPIPSCYLSELFAALCDMTASKILKSKYFRDIRKNLLAELKTWNEEKEFYFDEVHRYAYALAPIYAKQHPRWFEDLLNES